MISEFSTRRGVIDGLVIVSLKQVGDQRGIVRELFRRSAFEDAGIDDLGVFDQINVTESHRGAIRGMHAEATTKLLTVVAGEAFGAYVDLRPESPTVGRVETVGLRQGVQVLLPSGVANGFQAVTETVQYVYCFDREWYPGMPGTSCNPLDPALGIAWPIEIDPLDPSHISAKDRDAPALADIVEVAP